MSTHTSQSASTSRLLDGRFALQRLLANTALADIYWADDRQAASEGGQQQPVLALLLNPALSSLDGFGSTWQQVMARPTPAAAYPRIRSHGQDGSQYWLILEQAQGSLLNERMAELDKRGLPLDTALTTLENIYHALGSIQAGPFGYLEPGAIQQDEQHYRILNAPIVKALQLLNANGAGTINKLALHSAYLSPSVAVGDVPVTEDDSFSSACILHALLSGQPPFGEQSTLTAVTQGVTPPLLNKLNKESRETLASALLFQRSKRPENPDKLIQAIRRHNQRRLALPLAALAAAGVAVYAGYHLVSRVDDYLNVPATEAQRPPAAVTPLQEQPVILGAKPLTPDEPEAQQTPDTPQQTEPVPVTTAGTDSPVADQQTAETTTTDTETESAESSAENDQEQDTRRWLTCSPRTSRIPSQPCHNWPLMRRMTAMLRSKQQSKQQLNPHRHSPTQPSWQNHLKSHSQNNRHHNRKPARPRSINCSNRLVPHCQPGVWKTLTSQAPLPCCNRPIPRQK
ncbi:MAG: hypothetical protein R3E89_17615 [Thiolinea sp.]